MLYQAHLILLLVASLGLFGCASRADVDSRVQLEDFRSHFVAGQSNLLTNAVSISAPLLMSNADGSVVLESTSLSRDVTLIPVGHSDTVHHRSFDIHSTARTPIPLPVNDARFEDGIVARYAVVVAAQPDSRHLRITLHDVRPVGELEDVHADEVTLDLVADDFLEELSARR
jgi:hypothetical protein